MVSHVVNGERKVRTRTIKRRRALVALDGVLLRRCDVVPVCVRRSGDHNHRAVVEHALRDELCAYGFPAIRKFVSFQYGGRV